MNTSEGNGSLNIYTCIAPADIPWLPQLKGPVDWREYPIGAQPWVDHEQFSLVFDGQTLQMHAPGFRTPFVLKTEDLKTQTLVTQACSGKTRTGLEVLDLYAGYGLDGLGLSVHHNVTLVEIQPIVHALQVEFAWRSGSQVQHICGCAEDYLHASDKRWDVVYLDPMFPARRKQALPNRGMQHLQVLSRPLSVDLGAALSLARSRAIRRVVVKRRPKDPVINQPDFQLKGKAVRFDVYLPSH